MDLARLTVQPAPSLAGFARHVARLAERIRPGRWLLTTEDPYAMAVGLFAVAHANAIAVVPPNTRPGTLRELGDGILGQLSDDGAGTVALLQPDGGAERQLAPLNSESTVLELFTSGSTGAAKRVPKTLAHLATEVEALEGTFGPSMTGLDIVSTVSHNHLYGLLFRLLWPLRSGRDFASENLRSDGELFRCRDRNEPFALISSPAFLKRVTEATWRAVAPRCARIFSSGGPLEREDAARIAALTGREPTEIFGSTETGGVAWRNSGTEAASVWHTLPGVRIEIEAGSGRLAVDSPFVSEDAHPFVMGDRARIDGDSFVLLGRADRVINVGEHRVALGDLEALLEEHVEVARAALVQLDTGRIGAVVVPARSVPGDRDTRRRLGRTLRDHLGKHCAPVLLPRAWRYVARLPENSQGKVPRASLLELFEREDEAADAGLPTVLERTETGRRLILRARVPDTLPALAGHFPGRPIVPGVAQLGWVIHYGAPRMGGAVPSGVPRVRWKRPLLPGETFELEIEADAARRSLRFSFRQGDTLLSSGRIQFA